jgi:hypothetical protein
VKTLPLPIKALLSLIINAINMSSRYKSPLNLNNSPFNTICKALFALLNSTLLNAFNYIIATSLAINVSEEDALLLISRLRDTCKRLKPIYNK